MAVLQSCPYLVDCTLESDFIVHNELSDLHMTRLESLKIGVPWEPDFTAVFNCLTIPSAQNLSCYVLSGRANFPHSNFISLMSRSCCSLLTLSLSDLQIQAREIIECLRVVPSLQKLCLNNTAITNETFRMLTRHNLNLPNGLLPNLRVLKCFGIITFDFAVLENLLRSRWEPNDSESILADGEPDQLSRLQCVEFRTIGVGVPEPYLLSNLRDLAREGMKITITTADGEWLRGSSRRQVNIRPRDTVAGEEAQ